MILHKHQNEKNTHRFGFGKESINGSMMNSVNRCVSDLTGTFESRYLCLPGQNEFAPSLDGYSLQMKWGPKKTYKYLAPILREWCWMIAQWLFHRQEWYSLLTLTEFSEVGEVGDATVCQLLPGGIVAVSVAPIEFPLCRRGHWNASRGLEKGAKLYEGTMYMRFSNKWGYHHMDSL